MNRKEKVYWNESAQGYTDTILGELKGPQKEIWTELLKKHLPGRENLSVLDCGCGPGFFSILLSNMGHKVTAVDFSEKMLEEARKNIGKFGALGNVSFVQSEAQQPDVSEQSFDCIVSRNLTWVFKDLKQVYENWLSLLKPGGRIIVFDCNWYLYCFDKELFETDEKDLTAAINQGYPYGEVSRVYTFDKKPSKEEFPFADKKRPLWDEMILKDFDGIKTVTKENLPQSLRYGYYATRYAHTPYFMVCIEKSL